MTPDISPNHFLAITCCFCHTSYHPKFPPFVTLVHLVIISETHIDHIVLELHLSGAINIEYVKFLTTTCKKLKIFAKLLITSIKEGSGLNHKSLLSDPFLIA